MEFGTILCPVEVQRTNTIIATNMINWIVNALIDPSRLALDEPILYFSGDRLRKCQINGLDRRDVMRTNRHNEDRGFAERTRT